MAQSNFAVLHVTKYTQAHIASGAMGRHIDRQHLPENAIAELSDNNFELVDSSSSLAHSVRTRIEQGRTPTEKKIRKDAVLTCGVIFSGSHEQMKKLEGAGLVEEWAKDTFRFACEQWGEENIVRATVHMDEKTPHMHLHFVPLTKDGRLSAKEIVSKDNLTKLQDNYAELMSDYGLYRGVKNSRAKHVTTRQYYTIEGGIKKAASDLLEQGREVAIKTIELLYRTLESLTRTQHSKQASIKNSQKNYYEKSRPEQRTKQTRASRKNDGLSR